MPYTKLRALLEERGGAVSFTDFMAEALYGRDGYYARHIQTVGRGGDFSTSATLSPLLGRAIAAWLREVWAVDGWCPNVIEIGPGDGSLCAQVDAALGWWQRRRLHWHLVETSPVLQLQQQRRLGARGKHWHDSMEQALAACGGSAVIFSNEVPDAFPVTLLEWQDSEWHEVWLEINSAGGLVETIRPWSCENAALAALRPREGNFKTSQRVEFPSAWSAWLAGWRSQWLAGRMLTIDYGGPFAEVYARRPAGTLRAYLRHERKTGVRIYESMGRQDITADVCVDDLIRIGEMNDLETLGWQTQRRFILEKAGRPPQTREEVQLLDESGAGAAFFVLEQRTWLRPAAFLSTQSGP